ncbi:MAG TPA: FKBP-type peptidyl-prolyl cis-trans isomerase [Polyangiaceae bacterium]|nr:FKBP-type peptidyl-prolyl cis-trans isomerase [Polyangiaceae bacterium]
MPEQPLFQVGPDTVVHFSYRLYDGEGELVEGSSDAAVSFLFGYGQLAPALESALGGLHRGDSKRIKLRARDAFGERDPQKVLELDRSEFPPDIAPGDEFDAEDDQGDSVTLVVLDVDAERVVVDANHPLAGQSVELEVQIEAVRPALAAEISEASELLDASRGQAQGLLPATRLLRRPSRAADGTEPEPD